MNDFARSVSLLAGCCFLLLLTSCGPAPVKDVAGRELPPVGSEAQLIEPQGWLAKDESAFAELCNTGVRVLDFPPAEAQRQIALALEKNAKRLMEEDKVMKVGPSAKVRILGYYGGSASSIKPITTQERTAEFVKIEILEGSFKARTGFTTADAVK